MDLTVTRRRAIRSLGGAGVVALAGCTGDGGDGDTEASGDGGDTETNMQDTSTTQSSSQRLSIGVLQPLSGDLAYYGQQGLWGLLSGLAYKADADPPTDVGTGTTTVSAGDVEYELIVRDTEFTADGAQSAATDLVSNEGVDMLFGCSSSGAASRVITNVVKASSVPMMVGPAASAGITAESETCGDLVYRASENTAMDARSGGRYVATETDVSKVYLFGADYSFGRAVVNNYRSVLESEGIEIVGERFVNQGYSEWDGLLENAADAGAEGIVGGFTVATLPNLFSAFLSGDYSYRVFGGFATRITNAVVGQTMQRVLGDPLTEEKIEGAGLGPFTTRYHWNQYDNPINDAFVESYTNAYGVVPDLFTAGTFTGASAIHQAVTEGGSTDPDDITGALKGMTVTDTPKGENGYTFQEYNNQARSEMTVANPVPTQDQWADSWDSLIQPGDPLARISGDQVTIPADSDDMNCSL
ncbi:ABC transporter substrate-binding protein [Halomicrobium mukohataei]|uniref:ABC transporter substrate-binding protein n=1 Tax=Halomicrobium mukohataei TaxID=57705 RepID=A0A847UCG3_9EURY|nr:ABC transporter substrate-binding protein [Halomicrobium mukohataei]NLV10809.1 ABC transporter substrate-binding protein [Halomicrobium mukohataei]